MKDWHKIRGEIVEISNILDNAIIQAAQKYNISHKEREKVRQEAKRMGLKEIALEIQEAEDKEMVAEKIATKIVKNVKYRLLYNFFSFLGKFILFLLVFTALIRLFGFSLF